MVATPDSQPHTVQLLHELPDGSWHVDWMIDLDPIGQGRLMTFHLDRRLDQLEPGQHVQIDRIADHRRAYLEYEGTISGDRGEVTRIAMGHIEAFQTVGNIWALLIRWTIEGPQIRIRWQRLRMTYLQDGRWRLVDLGKPPVE